MYKKVKSTGSEKGDDEKYKVVLYSMYNCLCRVCWKRWKKRRLKSSNDITDKVKFFLVSSHQPRKCFYFHCMLLCFVTLMYVYEYTLECMMHFFYFVNNILYQHKYINMCKYAYCVFFHKILCVQCTLSKYV